MMMTGFDAPVAGVNRLTTAGKIQKTQKNPNPLAFFAISNFRPPPSPLQLAKLNRVLAKRFLFWQ